MWSYSDRVLASSRPMGASLRREQGEPPDDEITSNANIAYRWVRWTLWRGSPELIAHVARVSGRAVTDEAGDQPQISIIVEVGEDEELFNAPESFAEAVTKEALHRFTRIIIEAEGHEQIVVVTFNRDPSVVRRGFIDSGRLLWHMMDDDIREMSVVAGRELGLRSKAAAAVLGELLRVEEVLVVVRAAVPGTGKRVEETADRLRRAIDRGRFKAGSPLRQGSGEQPSLVFERRDQWVRESVGVTVGWPRPPASVVDSFSSR
jgi:hypothetical protein